MALKRSMAVDLDGKVQVNAVEMIAIIINMLNARSANNLSSLQKLAKLHLMGRLGSVEEVKNLVLSLAGEGFSFLHGACIDLSGAIASVLHDLDVKTKILRDEF